MRFAALFSLLLAAPAAAQTPATAPGDYEAARGAPFGAPAAYVWDIQVVAAGSETPETSSIDVQLGEDWARWRAGAQPARLVDLRAARLLTIDDTHDDEVLLTSTSLYAEARRRIDIYAGLSQGGSREMIPFGPELTFHRIWLEAAMGVSSQAGALEIAQDGGVLTAAFDGEVIASAWFAPGEASPCETDPPEHTAALLAHLRHAAPLHPDFFAAIGQMGVAPCALEFSVISPDSPEGRTERWTLLPGEADITAPLLPARARPTPAQADLVGAAAEAAFEIARSDGDGAPDEAEFYETMLALRAADDLAGAFLLTVQETHHFGPCPEQSIGSARLVCAELNALAGAGVGNAGFERAMEGMTAVRQGEHATAVGSLSPFLARDDRAGAAARILVANELVAWGRDGLQSRPDLDPAALLAEALVIDPFAPDAYWHLGRRYLEAGAPHAAWLFFDLGRALPGREATPLLAQADTLESRIAALAPAFAPAPESQGEGEVEPAPEPQADTETEEPAPETEGEAPDEDADGESDPQ